MRRSLLLLASALLLAAPALAQETPTDSLRRDLVSCVGMIKAADTQLTKALEAAEPSEARTETVRSRAFVRGARTQCESKVLAAVDRMAGSPDDPKPELPGEPVPAPQPEPEPQPHEWASGLWELSIDGQPGALDLDAQTVTLPRFGTLPVEIGADGGSLTVTFDLGAPGAGSLVLAHAEGRLTGTATAGGQAVSVTGHRPGDGPVPEEPAPGGPPPSLPPPVGGEGAPDFADDFASGDLSHTQGGFRWTNGRYVDVVSIDGQRALRFRFGPREPDGSSHMWAEQRFAHAPVQEYWMEFLLLVPSNYQHQRPNSANNNKLLAWWGPNGYSAPGMGMLQLWSGSTGPRSTVDYARYGPRSTYAEYVGGKHPLIDASMLGRWTRIRVHLRLADVGGADGRVRLWRDDALVLDVAGDANSADRAAANHLSAGYFLGYDNSGFAAETVFHVARVRWWSRNPGW